MNKNELIVLRSQFEVALEGILNFWIKHSVDNENGGFYAINKDNAVVQRGEKTSVLNARILWSFSAAYRKEGKEQYLQIANRAFEYVGEYFFDKEYGGTYLKLDYTGIPVSLEKQLYAEAFAIYGLSEYFLATGNKSSLDFAVSIFDLLEKYAFDPEHGGYRDVMERDWSPRIEISHNLTIEPVEKTLRTHMHILEAYLNLYTAWKNEKVKTRLIEIFEIMYSKILNNSNGSLGQLFSKDWRNLADIDSYGDDMEGSWLINECAEILEDEKLKSEAREASLLITNHVLNDGLDKEYGGIYNKKTDSELEENKEWWVQAEAVNGFLNAFKLSGQKEYFTAAISCWEFIHKHVINAEGEWYWNTTREGIAFLPGDGRGPMKCPYHNGRMNFKVNCSNRATDQDENCNHC